MATQKPTVHDPPQHSPRAASPEAIFRCRKSLLPLELRAPQRGHHGWTSASDDHATTSHTMTQGGFVELLLGVKVQFRCREIVHVGKQSAENVTVHVLCSFPLSPDQANEGNLDRPVVSSQRTWRRQGATISLVGSMCSRR
jgi:hypothetical protein